MPGDRDRECLAGESPQQREVSWPVNENRKENFKQSGRAGVGWLGKELEIEHIKPVVS